MLRNRTSIKRSFVDNVDDVDCFDINFSYGEKNSTLIYNNYMEYIYWTISVLKKHLGFVQYYGQRNYVHRRIFLPRISTKHGQRVEENDIMTPSKTSSLVKEVESQDNPSPEPDIYHESAPGPLPRAVLLSRFNLLKDQDGLVDRSTLIGAAPRSLGYPNHAMPWKKLSEKESSRNRSKEA